MSFTAKEFLKNCMFTEEMLDRFIDGRVILQCGGNPT